MPFVSALPKTHAMPFEDVERFWHIPVSAIEGHESEGTVPFEMLLIPAKHGYIG